MEFKLLPLTHYPINYENFTVSSKSLFLLNNSKSYLVTAPENILSIILMDIAEIQSNAIKIDNTA